ERYHESASSLRPPPNQPFIQHRWIYCLQCDYAYSDQNNETTVSFARNSLAGFGCAPAALRLGVFALKKSAPIRG
ncbi:MAG: hypothetical protein ABSE16_18005, partial [Verrucomicrobiota bacterium]